MTRIKHFGLIFGVFLTLGAVLILSACNGGSETTERQPESSSANEQNASTNSTAHENWARNPLIWADVPDPSIIRVDDTYYMSSTTMHMNPGLPIMKSNNLVDWELLGYVYDILSDGDESTLSNGENSYGEGSWASSLRYHQGRFYVSTFANHTGKTYIFSTDDIESGDWEKATIDELFHDASLVFDQGRVFLIYGNDDIHLVELNAEATAVKSDGLRTTLIEKASSIAGDEFWVPAEGAQLTRKDGTYYINLISWPANGMRTQLVYRAEQLTGPYEGRVVLEDRGIAQGGLIDTPDGDWYAFLFQDSGAVGRIPYLVPVQWQNGWPVYGVDGRVPDRLEIPSETTGSNSSGVNNSGVENVVASDEFDYESSEDLKLAWQWNHNPDEQSWSVTERPGYLTLNHRRIDQSLLDTRNTLTQRTFGPQSLATVALDVAKLRAGDRAGLAALQANYGFVGVEQSESERALVMITGTPDEEQVQERILLTESLVYLQVRADFEDQRDQATFWYSLDQESWTQISEPLGMEYTLPHFMGYRFALFSYATEQTGGAAAFDFYRIE